MNFKKCTSATQLVPFLAFASLLIGCSSQPLVVVQEDLAKPAVNLVATNDAAPLIRIRYPVGIDPSVPRDRFAAAFKEAELRGPFRSRAYDGRLGIVFIPISTASDDPSYQSTSDDELLTAVSTGLAKTQFYTLDFYSSLSASFPPGTVLLEPSVYTLGQDGKFFLKPAQPSTPTPVSIDFGVGFASVKGDRNPPFGGEVHPMISIVGYDSAGKVEFLASNDFFTQGDNRIAGLSPETVLNLTKDQTPATDADLTAAGFTRRTSGKSSTKTARLLGLHYGRPSSFFMDMRDKETASYFIEAPLYVGAKSGATGPMAPVWGMYANVIKDYLNSTQPAARIAFQATQYSKLLNLPAQTDPRLLQQLIQVEQKFQVGCDSEFARDAYDGEFGSSMRQQIAAEYEFEMTKYRIARERRQAQSQAMTMSMASSMGAMNGTVSPMQNLQNQVTAMGAMASANSAADRRMASLNSSFRRHFERVIPAQSQYVVLVGGKEYTLRATSLAELREGLAKIAKQPDDGAN